MEDSGSPDLGSNPRGTTMSNANYSSSVFLFPSEDGSFTSDMSPVKIENMIKIASGKVATARIGNM